MTEKSITEKPAADTWEMLKLDYESTLKIIGTWQTSDSNYLPLFQRFQARPLLCWHTHQPRV